MWLLKISKVPMPEVRKMDNLDNGYIRKRMGYDTLPCPQNITQGFRVLG